MKNRRLYLSLAVLCVILFASSAPGAVIDFGTGMAGPGGIVTEIVTGTRIDLIGSKLKLDVLSAIDTPQNPGTYDLSGPLGTGSIYAELDFDTRGSTPTITITGGVPAFGIPSKTVLLSGKPVSWSLSPLGLQFLVSLSGTDGMSNLAPHFGLSNTIPFSFLMLAMDMKRTSPNTYLTLNTDFSNTAVPLPPALLLLAPGLAGLIVVRRRSIRIRGVNYTGKTKL